MRWSINQQKAAGSNDTPNVYAIPAYSSFTSLNRHRRWDVRNENRATFLARAYIAGMAYASVEATRKPENEYKFKNYIIPRVAAMVAKYGTKTISLKVWDSSTRTYVPNPLVKQLEADIVAWSTIN